MVKTPPDSQPLGLNLFRAESVLKSFGFKLPQRSPCLGFLVRIGLAALFCWLPILLLALLERSGANGSVEIVFLHDWAVHLRFLIVLPLFLMADSITNPQLDYSVNQFVSAKIVGPHEVARYEEIVEHTSQLARHPVAYVTTFALVAVAAFFGLSREAALEISSWQRVPGTDEFSMAGFYFSYVGIPAYQFVLLNWLWRYFLWCRFMWQASKLSLQLYSAHPDRAGGLGFLSIAQLSFSPFILGFSTIYCTILAKEIASSGLLIGDFILDIVFLIVINTIVFLLPLLMFSPRLIRQKLVGVQRINNMLGEYASGLSEETLQDEVHRDLTTKGRNTIDEIEPLFLAHSAVMRSLPVPFGLPTIVVLALMSLSPLVIVFLSIYSTDELLVLFKNIVRHLF